jgi:hypothetical protein
MRILVCGGRDYTDKAALYRVLDAALRSGALEIIQGGAKGADRLAQAWATERGVACTTFEADWDLHGKGAGFIRNRQMLSEGRPGMVLAFPGGRGTANMVKQAQERGVLVVKYPPTGDHRMPFDLE